MTEEAELLKREIVHLKNFGTSFDPIVQAGLTEPQCDRMQAFIGAQSTLKDANGLRLFVEVDFWKAAQLVSMLYAEDGSARSSDDVMSRAMGVKT